MKKCEKKSTYYQKLYSGVIWMLCLFFMLIAVFFTGNIFATDDKDFSKNETEIFYENQNPINLYEIMEQNTKNNQKEEMVVEEIDMEYTTRYKNNQELASGVVQVLQEGRAGTTEAIIIKK